MRRSSPCSPIPRCPSSASPPGPTVGPAGSAPAPSSSRMLAPGRVVLEANPAYWGGAAPVEPRSSSSSRATTPAPPPTSTRARWTSTFPPAPRPASPAPSRCRAGASATSRSRPSGSRSSGRRIRQGVAAALDQSALASVLEPHAVPLTTPLPPGVWGHQPGRKPPDNRAETARRLLVEGGAVRGDLGRAHGDAAGAAARRGARRRGPARGPGARRREPHRHGPDPRHRAPPRPERRAPDGARRGPGRRRRPAPSPLPAVDERGRAQGRARPGTCPSTGTRASTTSSSAAASSPAASSASASTRAPRRSSPRRRPGSRSTRGCTGWWRARRCGTCACTRAASTASTACSWTAARRALTGRAGAGPPVDLPGPAW